MLARAYVPQQWGPDRVPLFRQAVGKRDEMLALAYFFIAQELAVAGGEVTSQAAQQIEREIGVLRQTMSTADIAAASQKRNSLQQAMHQSMDVRLPATGWDERDQYLATPSLDRCDQRSFIN